MFLAGKNNKLISIVGFFLAVFAASLMSGDLAQGLRAPAVTNKDTYYYVSDDVPDNGGFPDTYVGFYWNANSGSRTITYNPAKCNNGGYEDTTDGDPNLIIYGMNSDGSINWGNVIKNWTHINSCHGTSSSTNFTFDLSSTSRDTNIDMKGVVVRVESEGDGMSRAWFTLETSDTDGASFGAMGNYPVGYSRDFSSGAGGNYYNLETGFGSCDAAGGSGSVDIFDADTTKYQSSKALKIKFYNNNTGSYVSSGNPPISNKNNIKVVDGTTLKATGESSSDSSLTIKMATKTGYRMDLTDLREGNDITVTVPTNEIYSKKVCRQVWSLSADTSINKTTASVGDSVVWTHTVNNNGPDSTDRTVNLGYNHTNGWSGSSSMGNSGAGDGVGNISTYTESHTIQQSDVGKTLCSQAYGSPRSSTDGSAVYAGSKCVTVLGWSIGASTTVNMNDATVGDVVNWTHTVRNNGPGSTGSPISTGYNHTGDWSGSTGTGAWNPVQVNGATTSRTESYTIQQSDVGKTLCSQAYGSPASNSNSATVYATSQCVTVRNWELTALTYSAVNPANPMDNGQYNNTRKIAYPNYAAFGGHIAKPTDDKIYYAVNVQRGNDGGTRPSTFKYRPVWLFGTGMITANNVNSGQSDVSSLCAGLGFSYEPSFKRCSKNAPVFIDTSLPSGGASAFYTSTEPGRHWNNSMPMPTADLSKLKGMDICYILSLNRNRASQLNDENAAHFYWGSLDGTTENRCSVTVGTPWILEPRVSSIPADSSVGDTYTVTPRVGSSDATIQGTQHNISLVRVIGLSTWNPTMGLNVMGSPSPSSVNYGVGADGASATTISIDSNVTDPSFNNPSKVWSGTGVNEEFQEAWYGKKVCYYTVIATGGWAYDKIGEVRYSNPVCTKWAKGPQIQVRGADAYSGGSWTNSDSTVSTFNGGFEASSQSKSWRGSWSQYGLLSYKAPISEFGSSGYTMSTGSDTAKACSLIFANTINSSNCPSDGGSLYGNSSIDRKISLPKEAMFTDAEIDALPTVGSSYYGTRVIAGNTVSTLKLDNVPNGVYQVPHDTYIQDTKLRSSSQIVIVSKGTVHVDSGGVTTAASTFASLKDVPVFTLIARQILSQDSDAPRTQESIYGTYIATGSAAGQAFTSCYVANSTDVELRDGGFCGYQLRINGAVISRKTPILRRTIGGARTTINITANGETHQDAMTASEVFNYQPSLFLTPYALKDDGGTGSVWVTDRQTVLPARF